MLPALTRKCWVFLVNGLRPVAFDVMALATSIAALLFIVAIWAIARGIAEIVTAIQVRRFLRNEWTLTLAGAAAILFGVMLIAKPGTGALALLGTIGSFAKLRGGLFIALAVRLRLVAAAQPAH